MSRASASRRARRLAGEHIAIAARCAACGNETLLRAARGEAHLAGIEHEDDCPFLAAIELGAGAAYVAEHGYPIRYVRMGAMGAA